MLHIRKCDAFSVTHKWSRVIDFSTHVCGINHAIWRKTSFTDQESERDNPFLKILENLRIFRILVHGENQKVLRVFRSGFGIKLKIYFLLLFTFLVLVFTIKMTCIWIVHTNQSLKHFLKHSSYRMNSRYIGYKWEKLYLSSWFNTESYRRYLIDYKFKHYNDKKYNRI